jgi:hypothetical protein
MANVKNEKENGNNGNETKQVRNRYMFKPSTFNDID